MSGPPSPAWKGNGHRDSATAQKLIELQLEYVRSSQSYGNFAPVVQKGVCGKFLARLYISINGVLISGGECAWYRRESSRIRECKDVLKLSPMEVIALLFRRIFDVGRRETKPGILRYSSFPGGGAPAGEAALPPAKRGAGPDLRSVPAPFCSCLDDLAAVGGCGVAGYICDVSAADQFAEQDGQLPVPETHVGGRPGDHLQAILAYRPQRSSDCSLVGTKNPRSINEHAATTLPQSFPLLRENTEASP